MSRAFSAAVFAGLVLSQCTRGGSDIEGAGWVATVDTVGDTVVLRTESGSVWHGTATLTPEVTIGVVEGEAEYMYPPTARAARNAPISDPEDVGARYRPSDRGL